MELSSAADAGVSYARAEQQRVEHLVLGRARPPARGVGKGRAKRKVPVVLVAGVEEAVALRERWSHKQGTPETHEHASAQRQGAIARLYRSGAIDVEQLGSAVAIASVHERIAADVTVRTANLEPAIDATRMGDSHFYEALGQVRREVAYGRWRAQLRGDAAAALDMIAGDEGVTIVARRRGMHVRRARRLLIDALDAWPRAYGAACKEIDEATLAAAQAGIL